MHEEHEPRLDGSPPTHPGAIGVATAVGEVAGPPPVALDAAGCIAQDLACRSCGYSLRGLPTTGRCPECSEAIGRSIHGDLLQFSDPAWVERVARGVRWLVIAFIVSIVGGMLLGVMVAAIGIGLGIGSPWILAVPLVLYAIVVSAMSIAGYWMATSPDPGVDESQQPLTVRAIARWSIVAQSAVSIVALPFQLGSSVLPMGGGGTSPDVTYALGVSLNALATALGVVGMVAMLAYAAKLAKRIPDDRIAKQCRIVMWGYGIAGSLMFLGAVCMIGAGGDTSHPMMIAAQIANVVGGIPMLVFGIWALVLLFRFRSRLRTAAQQARATWARTNIADAG
jgi:hypothetical protein